MHRVALRQDNSLLAIAQWVGNRSGPVLQRSGLGFPNAFPDGARECSTVTQVEFDVLARFEFLTQTLSPALEVVHPPGDREDVAAEGLCGELRLPAVVAHGAHGHCVPVLCPFVAIEEDCGDGIMAVGKDVRLNGYAFADCALGRKS